MIAWPTHKARAATARKKHAADKRRNQRLRRLVMRFAKLVKADLEGKSL